VDAALRVRGPMQQFLRQSPGESTSLHDTARFLAELRASSEARVEAA
jgi:hypothetical protein